MEAGSQPCRVAAWAKGRHKADLGELGLSLSLRLVRTRLGREQVRLSLVAVMFPFAGTTPAT